MILGNLLIILLSFKGAIAFSGSTRKVIESSSSGPKSDSSRRQRRASNGQRRSEPVEVFDPKLLTSQQISNESACPLDLFSYDNLMNPSFLRHGIESEDSRAMMGPARTYTSDSFNFKIAEECKGPLIDHTHFEMLSLDDLFPNLDFSKHFFLNGKFRQSLRVAIRNDIFYTTPAYSQLSPKVAAMMLDDDSSLQGTWNCIPRSYDPQMALPTRMTRLTQVLQDTLGANAPSGDEFMIKIGSLTGTDPSYHWIDIIGVKDRKILHSWHQDTGSSYKDQNSLDTSRYTVMLGFPIEDSYTGCGVFSHCIKLTHEHLAPKDHNQNEPILFQGDNPNDLHIVRPEFGYKKELLRYRDVDIIHSAPDVAYRKSVMRFM